MTIVKTPFKLYPSPAAVITLFLSLPGAERITHMIARVERLSEEEVTRMAEDVMKGFADRHRNITGIFRDHFNRINEACHFTLCHFSETRKLLTGSLFTKEYSIQAAALFNPSVVSHPDQDGLPEGTKRFVMSLRATGEGHISSVVFSTGTLTEKGDMTFDPLPEFYTPLQKNEKAVYHREWIRQRAYLLKDFPIECLGLLPEKFTAAEAIKLFPPSEAAALEQLKSLFDSNYELSSSDTAIREKVIFPCAKEERMGMEDLRFVHFKDDGISCYYATYTAYDGSNIRTKLIETTDFQSFKIRTLYGKAVSDKGMALFPEKVNGQYVMISRQGGANLQIMFSGNLYEWNDYKTLMEPRYPWELVQLGNCGSPVKTPKGWLLLTHGVGAMRKYVISAILLDLADPSVIIGRLDQPLLEADETEREGYVPNVVYTCGLLRHGNILLIPYAVSDSATGFATIELNEIVQELIKNQ